jgi:hypothetical protein
MFIGDHIFIENASPSVTYRLCVPQLSYTSNQREYSSWVMYDSRSMRSFCLGWFGCMFKTLSSTQTPFFWFISLFLILSFQMQWKLVSLTSKECYQVGCETTCSHGFRYCKCIFSWYYDSIIHMIQ